MRQSSMTFVSVCQERGLTSGLGVVGPSESAGLGQVGDHSKRSTHTRRGERSGIADLWRPWSGQHRSESFVSVGPAARRLTVRILMSVVFPVTFAIQSAPFWLMRMFLPRSSVWISRPTATTFATASSTVAPALTASCPAAFMRPMPSPRLTAVGLAPFRYDVVCSRWARNDCVLSNAAGRGDDAYEVCKWWASASEARLARAGAPRIFMDLIASNASSIVLTASHWIT